MILYEKNTGNTLTLKEEVATLFVAVASLRAEVQEWLSDGSISSEDWKKLPAESLMERLEELKAVGLLE